MLRYLAPEVVQTGKWTSGASDVYAFGLLFYEMVLLKLERHHP